MTKFELSLDHGPYFHSYTRNGRHLVLGGNRGHLSLIDWKRVEMKTEIFVDEEVKDVCALFDDSMFAVAQKRYTYIYDNMGIEIHCIRKHSFVNKIDFLPYHFLLCSVGRFGNLKYIDVSTGEEVAKHHTKFGSCHVLEVNPYNGVVHLGHLNGSVSLWAPKSPEPLVKLFCHHGPVTSMNIDLSGRYMITCGGDNKIKIWDIRKFKEIRSIKQQAVNYNTMALSQTNVLAIATGPKVTLWENVFNIDLADKKLSRSTVFSGRRINRLKFCPYEDSLGVSLENGFVSHTVPGSGEPYFDSTEVNPFETKREKSNRLVRNLLEKIQPEFITLDPNDVAQVYQRNDDE